MPRRAIDRATNFIIEDESWVMVEYDYTSVPGVIYLSLTESKVNMIYDDLVEDIADTDKRANYQLLTPSEIETFDPSVSHIEPTFTLTKNGLPYKADILYISLDKTKLIVRDNIIYPTSAEVEGEAQLKLQLKDYPNITLPILTIKLKGATYSSAYIEGPAAIRLDRMAEYRLVFSGVQPEVDFTFELKDEADGRKYAIIVPDENAINTCKIKANNKNILGSFVLEATNGEQTYTKELTIIPLW